MWICAKKKVFHPFSFIHSSFFFVTSLVKSWSKVKFFFAHFTFHHHIFFYGEKNVEKKFTFLKKIEINATRIRILSDTSQLKLDKHCFDRKFFSSYKSKWYANLKLIIIIIVIILNTNSFKWIMKEAKKEKLN